MSTTRASRFWPTKATGLVGGLNCTARLLLIVSSGVGRSSCAVPFSGIRSDELGDFLARASRREATSSGTFSTLKIVVMVASCKDLLHLTPDPSERCVWEARTGTPPQVRLRFLPSCPTPRDPEVPQDEAPTEPELAEAEEAGNSALRSFLGLFIVPLLVVLLCVAIFIGFGWIAYDRQSTRDYLSDLESGWKPRRVQAAYELSKILVSDPRALDKEPRAKAQVRRLFEEADDAEMRRYLALVLGRTGDREALPLLTTAANDEDDRTRIYALLALGLLGDARARDPLAKALSDEDPGIRKTAAFALGLLDPRSVGYPLLSDQRRKAPERRRRWARRAHVMLPLW